MRKKISLFLLISLLFLGGFTVWAATPAKVAVQAPAKPAVKPVVKKAPVKPAVKPVVKKAPVKPAVKGFTDKEAVGAKKAAIDFVKNYLVEDGTTVDVKIYDKYNGLYFLKIGLKSENGEVKDVEAAITANGKYFFPQFMDIVKTKKDEAEVKKAPAPVQKPVAETAPKSDKPVVEVFVMSHCPYGTQIEKGILPVVKTLGDKADMQIKFVDYTMHGEKEALEQIRQYCIKEEQKDKFWSYLECFLKAGDNPLCLKENNINETSLADCEKRVVEKYNTKGTAFSIYGEENKKYGVQGSPTLVINGKVVSSSRDSASLLKNICASFNTPPEECKTVLSGLSPAPGFGSGVASNSSSGGCGQ